MKRIILGFIVIALTVILTGCHPCDSRKDEDPNYLEVLAETYGLEAYTNENIFFQDAEKFGELVTGARCQVTPEQDHRMLVDHKDDLLKILVVPECKSDDIYFYETTFLSVELINEVVGVYNLETNTPITVFEETLYSDIMSHYQFVFKEDKELEDFVVYYIGDLDNDKELQRVFLVKKDEDTYQIITDVVHFLNYTSEVLYEFDYIDGEIVYQNTLERTDLEGYSIVNTINDISLWYSNHDVCAEMIEELFSDDKYDYFFPCLRNEDYYLEIDSKYFRVVEAVDKGIITPFGAYILFDGVMGRSLRDEN